MNDVVTKISSFWLGLAAWQKITKALFRQLCYREAGTVVGGWHCAPAS